MDKFKVWYRNPRTENKDLQCEPAFQATSAEDARDHFINVLEMVDVSVEPVELEASRDTLADALTDAGFGSAGPM